MKVLVCEQPGSFRYAVREKPALIKGNALLRIKRIGICGTDLHAFEGTQPYFTYPRVLGHELAAEIAGIENNTGYKAGQRVTFIPYFNCGECMACRNGLTNCCVSMNVFGVHSDGGMAEYVSVPVEYLVDGRGLGLDELALVEPLAIGAHSIRRAMVKPGEFVVVIGAGPIGMGVMEFARIAGARVIAMDVNEGRLAFCKDKLKIEHGINPLATNVLADLQSITHGDMPGVVIDATGNLQAIHSAFRYMAHGARYILVGLQKEEIHFSHPEFHKREAALMSSRNATRQDFDHVLDCVEQKLVDPAAYITHRVAFNQVKTDFESWLDPANGVIKAMVEL